MKATLITWWTSIRESYWFIPSLMALGAIMLSFLTTALDSAIGSQWLEDISWLYANKPDGARAVLSTVAGSMITVAGVTFSMTLLSISYTTGQVGPRLLNNFMRDLANQFTLGTFIATFLYCLMVLRTVRNADTPSPSGSGDTELVAAFVPHVAVSVGLLLAVASVGVLIFFIHHIPESMHISNIVARVGRDLQTQVEKQFPSRIGSSRPAEQSGGDQCSSAARSSVAGGRDDAKGQGEARGQADLPPSFYSAARAVSCPGTGYVEFVDTESLMHLAREHDLLLRLKFRPGDFVTAQDVLLLAAPAERVDEQLAQALIGTFVWGNQRTATQNLRFVMNQLVEVAARALSPGINDPFTATNCMDWLQAGLQSLAQRQLPDAHRYDEDQQLRIVAEPDSYESLVSLVFDQLRPYVSVDRNAAVHMMEMLAKLAVHAETNAQRRVLLGQASALKHECGQTLQDKRGLQVLGERYRSLIGILYDPAYRAQVLQSGNWIGGRA